MNRGYTAATDQNDNWRTPDWLFRALDAEFAFDLDAAADAENTKCAKFISQIETVMMPDLDEQTVFCNPPFSNIQSFVSVALDSEATWVLILPVRTRTAWFRDLRWGKAEFRWFRKRIAFDPPPSVEPSSPRMDTFIAVIR